MDIEYTPPYGPTNISPTLYDVFSVEFYEMKLGETGFGNCNVSMDILGPIIQQSNNIL